VIVGNITEGRFCVKAIEKVNDRRAFKKFRTDDSFHSEQEKTIPYIVVPTFLENLAIAPTYVRQPKRKDMSHNVTISPRGNSGYSRPVFAVVRVPFFWIFPRLTNFRSWDSGDMGLRGQYIYYPSFLAFLGFFAAAVPCRAVVPGGR